MNNKKRFWVAVIGSFILALIAITTQQKLGETLHIDYDGLGIGCVIGIILLILWAGKGSSK